MDNAQSIAKQEEKAQSKEWALRILNCSGSVPVADKDMSGLALDALRGLLNRIVGYTDDIEEDVLPALQAAFGDSLRIHTVFSFCFPSDELSCAYALSLCGTPFLVHRRVGDCMEYYQNIDVVERAIAKEVAAVLMNALMDQALNGKGDDEPMLREEDFFENNSYLQTLGKGLYLIEAPRTTNYTCAFKSLNDATAAYLLLDGGKIAKVKEFLGWEVKEVPYGRVRSKEDQQARFMTVDGEVRHHDASLVVFSLTNAPDEEYIKQISAMVYEPMRWRAHALNKRVGRGLTTVDFLMRAPGHYFATSGTLVFARSDDANARAEALYAKFEGWTAGALDEELHLKPFMRTGDFFTGNGFGDV